MSTPTIKTPMVDALCAVVNNQLKRRTRESDEEEPATVDKFEVTYKDLMAKIVCDTTYLECMVHSCENCPGYTALEAFIK